MKSILSLLSIVFVATAVATDSLPRATPESQGVSSVALGTLFEKLSEIDAVHSAIIVRHGHVIAEGWWQPYVAERRHKLYSLSKSFTSTAVGMVIAEGNLSLDDTILSFFPEHAPETPSNHLKNMRVRDLLSMSTGHISKDLKEFSFTEADEPLIKTFLNLPVAHKPGTHFLYNTPATYMCSAIVQKITGQSTHDYLKEHLFPHLGIVDSHWETSPEGVSLGGFGLNVKTEDIAKLGQLYLQRGEWDGKRLLPASWIDAATARQTSNGSNPNSDWDQGYGYQFWRCRHDAYRGDGAFGQFCIVLPEHDTVVAITSGTNDMQGVMSAVWDGLLPALAPVPLPEDVPAQEELVRAVGELKLPRIQGEAIATHAAAYRNKVYTFETNPHGIESVSLVGEDRSSQLEISLNGQVASIQELGIVLNGRLDSHSSADPSTEIVWTSPKSLKSRTHFTRSPYTLTLELEFENSNLTLTPEWNVAFGPKKLEAISGSHTQQP